MATEIKSGAGVDLQTVDPTSKAGRVTIYDTLGNVVSSTNRAVVAETTGGVIIGGKEYKTARSMRAMPSGAMSIEQEVLLFYDGLEGTTKNSILWMENISGMASAQAVNTGLTLNSGAVTSSGSSIREFSQKQFQKIARMPLVWRGRLRSISATNSTGEWGFCEISSGDVQISDGVFFRREAAGTMKGVIAVDGTEVLTASMTAPASTDYANYEIFWEDDRATFTIHNSDGSLLSSATVELTASITRICSVTHVAAFYRINTTGVTSPAQQIIVGSIACYYADALIDRNWSEVMAALGFHSLINPSTLVQVHQYSNSADPSAAVLSNTAASYANLGGLWIGPTPTPAGAATDFALFALAIPAPYTFFFKGVTITSMNRGVAVATTATVLEWALAFNSSAVSLATGSTYPPIKIPIGRQVFPIAAAVEALPGNPVVSWTPAVPIPVYSTKFFHVILRIPVGTATTNGFLRGHVHVDGWFE